jgi:hypothetical protein
MEDVSESEPDSTASIVSAELMALDSSSGESYGDTARRKNRDSRLFFGLGHTGRCFFLASMVGDGCTNSRFRPANSACWCNEHAKRQNRDVGQKLPRQEESSEATAERL